MTDQKTEQKTLQDELLDEVKRQLQTIDELVALSLGVSVERLQASCNRKPGGERAYTVDLIARAEAARNQEAA